MAEEAKKRPERNPDVGEVGEVPIEASQVK